jgi:hypothetical protein
MDSYWPAVLGVVLIAAAGGLAFVAYRHPAAFRENLGLPLAFLTAVAFIVLSFWNLGALHAQSQSLLNAVKDLDRAGSASATVSSLAERIRETYLLEVYGLLIAVAIIAYLLLLSRLPELGVVQKKEEGSTDEPVSGETTSPTGPAPNEPSSNVQPGG